MAALAKLGIVADLESLAKLRAADVWEEELEVMAQVLAYWKVSSSFSRDEEGAEGFGRSRASGLSTTYPGQSTTTSFASSQTERSPPSSRLSS